MRPTRARCPSLLIHATPNQHQPSSPSTCPAKHHTFSATDNGRDPCICTTCVHWMCTHPPGSHGTACRLEILASHEPPRTPTLPGLGVKAGRKECSCSKAGCPRIPESSHGRRRCIMSRGAVRVDPTSSQRKRAPSAAPPDGWHHVVLRATEIRPLRAAAASSLRSPTSGHAFESFHALQPPIALPCTCIIKPTAVHTISFLLVRTTRRAKKPF